MAHVRWSVDAVDDRGRDPTPPEPCPEPILKPFPAGITLTLLSVSTAVLASDDPSPATAPLRLETSTLTAEFSGGSLVSLVDREGRVWARPAQGGHGLGIHRVEATHYATAAGRECPSRADGGEVVRRFEQFGDLEGATAECAWRVDDATGDLVLRQRCSSPAEGVWGVSWQVAHVPLDCAVIVPGRSGVRLTAATPGREHTFDYPIGWEAQLVIVEGEGAGFSVWAGAALVVRLRPKAPIESPTGSVLPTSRPMVRRPADAREQRAAGSIT